jgi:hypothetical protein
MAAADVLTNRALNRTTLARQFLLERSSRSPLGAVEHLVGLQAQIPLDPYLALWSRLESFDPDVVGKLVEDRALVRIVVMRGTIHLVTADDALVLRPLMQPVLEAELHRHGDFAPHLLDVDLAPMLRFARRALAERPMSTPQLRAVLDERFPDLHAGALAYACRCLLPLVQVPPRGVWGKTLQVTLAPLESWVGRDGPPSPSIDEVVERYLRAFGPATVADVTTWSRLTGLRAVVDRLRPRLRTFRDERGRELFDVPDGMRPDPETPAPVRFLPEYDNALLSHADRSRFSPAPAGWLAATTGPIKGTVLVDGLVQGVWRPERAGGRGTSAATVVVEHLALPRRARAAVEAEAAHVVRFLHPNAADHRIRLVAVG